MKVFELVTKLQEMPQDLRIVQNGYESGWEDIYEVSINKLVKVDGPDWEGTYQQSDIATFMKPEGDAENCVTIG
jgi:hypothetical protein